MKNRSNWLRLLLLLICVAVAVFSGIRLISYFGDLAEERRSADELKAIYYATEAPVTEPVETPETTATPTAETARETETPVPTAVALATPTPMTHLPVVRYPGDKQYGVASESFLKLKQKNQDIVGWLTIDGVVDQGVVQRDNTYYLNHDYLGNKNVNGALFLDMAIPLSSRPYTLMVYGHNMKTGEMFGKMLKYKQVSWYRDHAFVTFNSQYEDGRYIIFSAARVQVVPGTSFVNLYALLTDEVAAREEVIRQLDVLSCFNNYVDVRPEDQILLLITCDGNDDERFVVAARRIRDGESEAALAQYVMKSSQKR